MRKILAWLVVSAFVVFVAGWAALAGWWFVEDFPESIYGVLAAAATAATLLGAIMLFDWAWRIVRGKSNE